MADISYRHIDGIGTVSAIRQDDIAVWYTISASPSILRYIIEKGSIAIDGISLTVATVTDIDFSVSIIPHTAAQTTLSRRKSGDIVNLENDVIGKYVEKLLQPAVTTPKTEASSITMDFIEKYGF